MKRAIRSTLLLAWLSLLLAGGTAAGPRVALVIGNNAYRNTTPLTNCINDARAIADALLALGFEVETLTDAERAKFDEGFGWLEKKVKGADLGVVFYSGHGVAVAGVNYLVPVEANPESESQIRRQGFNASEIVASLQENGCKTSIVILDACRNNPFGRRFRGSASRGLAQMEAGPDSLIAFAADAGQVADDNPGGGNGLYTSELIRHLRTPGLPIEEVFKRTRAAVLERSGGKQLPAEYSKLLKDIVLVPAAGPPATPAASAPPSPAPAPSPQGRPPERSSKSPERECYSHRNSIDKAIGVWESQNVAIPNRSYDIEFRRDGTIQTASPGLAALSAPDNQRLRAGSRAILDWVKEPALFACPRAPDAAASESDYQWLCRPTVEYMSRGAFCKRCGTPPPPAPLSSEELGRVCHARRDRLDKAIGVWESKNIAIPTRTSRIEFRRDGTIKTASPGITALPVPNNEKLKAGSCAILLRAFGNFECPRAPDAAASESDYRWLISDRPLPELEGRKRGAACRPCEAAAGRPARP